MAKIKKTITTPKDRVFEFSISDDSIQLLLPLAILIASILIVAAIIYSTEKVKASIENMSPCMMSEQTPKSSLVSDDVEKDDPNDSIDIEDSEYETFNTFNYDPDATILTEDGKISVALISTSSCPHCLWIKETFDNWAKENSDKYTIHHWEWSYNDDGSSTLLDTITGTVLDDLPTNYTTLYSTYSGGYVPTFIFGGKYFRVGNAFESNSDVSKEEALQKEIEEYISVLEKIESEM